MAVVFAANPVPVNVTVAGPVAMGICCGVTLVNTGSALVIENVTGAAADPPPGAGFETPMLKLPAAWRNDADNVPDNEVAEPNVVGIGVPENVIVDAGPKFAPET